MRPDHPHGLEEGVECGWERREKGVRKGRRGRECLGVRGSKSGGERRQVIGGGRSGVRELGRGIER